MEFSLKKAALGVFIGMAVLPGATAADEPVPVDSLADLVYFNYILQVCGTEGDKLTARIQLGTTRDNYINEIQEMDRVQPLLSGERAERYLETMPEDKRAQYDATLRQRMADALIGDPDAYFNYLGSVEDAGVNESRTEVALPLLQEKLQELSAAFAQAEQWDQMTAVILPNAPDAVTNLCLQEPQVTLQPII